VSIDSPELSGDWDLRMPDGNGGGKPCAGEPHGRFDRGPLGRLTPRRDGIHAPNGKPTGLSPPAAPATPNQRPTSPVRSFPLFDPVLIAWIGDPIDLRAIGAHDRHRDGQIGIPWCLARPTAGLTGRGSLSAFLRVRPTTTDSRISASVPSAAQLQGAALRWVKGRRALPARLPIASPLRGTEGGSCLR
jgi:hypothetical protein